MIPILIALSLGACSADADEFGQEAEEFTAWRSPCPMPGVSRASSGVDARSVRG